ncbi:MAG TPA: HAMP domain-containing sensor histidine kinase [Gemmatimonadaceae bacterium]|nr:HAMP domain-containing sensor histidine kinase [Gemmatimonadaceae bacterium]
MRRAAPVVVLGILILLLLGSYVVYTRGVVLQLRGDASHYARMYSRVFDALADPSSDAANAALFDLAADIRDLGVPVVVTDAAGRPAAVANLPFEATLDDPRVMEYVEQLDRINPPVIEPGLGTVHYGDSQLVTSLRFIPVLQAALLAIVFVAGVYVLRTRSRADRERVWAGMARESAHQLATPLSSISGWIELLRERADEPVVASALQHMEVDLERLERVAHRFERIGRPPRRDPVDLGELATNTATYFQARVPTLAHRVEISVKRDDAPLVVEGDAVLLEWALESLAKNALDALAGRGGHLEISAERLEPEKVRVRVADDGPGIARELRSRIFEPGFSTKESGWGIGLSLAKRIIEENHRGKLVLAAADRGATFDVILEG